MTSLKEISKIYIDLDGVCADFDKWVKAHPGVNDDNLWGAVKEVPNFYYHLDPMPDFPLLMEYLRSLNTPLAILTAIPRRSTIPSAEDDKKRWVRKHIGDIEFHIGPHAVDKQRFSGPGLVLIDDSELNIPQWESRGGIGFLYTDFNRFVKEFEARIR